MKKQTILFLAFLIILFFISTIMIVNSEPHSDIIVYIDPGHGGFDGGAVGVNNVVEKNIVLEISLLLANYLRKTGIQVLLTRDIDESLASNKTEDIHKRVKLINEKNPTLYVSIHANSYPEELVFGAQTFYNPTHQLNSVLAKSIQDMLKIIDQDNQRLAKSIQGKYLIDQVHVTGCLIEVGFLTNKSESIKLQDPDYQSNIALMIYIGILNFLEKT